MRHASSAWINTPNKGRAFLHPDCILTGPDRVLKGQRQSKLVQPICPMADAAMQLPNVTKQGRDGQSVRKCHMSEQMHTNAALQPCGVVALSICLGRETSFRNVASRKQWWENRHTHESWWILMNHQYPSHSVDWEIHIDSHHLVTHPASQLMDVQTKFSRWFRNPAPFGHNSATIPLWRNFSRVGPVKAWAKLDKQPSCFTQLNMCAMQWAKYARNRYLEIPSAFAQ